MSTALQAGLLLPLARYRLCGRVCQPLQLPDFTGSLLRSVFGAALRQRTCITGKASCAGCMATDRCIYANVFDTPAPTTHALQRFTQVPNPYVIEASNEAAGMLSPGQSFQFGMVLIGRSLTHLPELIQAWRSALQSGLGSRRSRVELTQVYWTSPAGEQLIWESGQHAPLPHQPQIEVPAFLGVHQATLHVATPLRLQSQGKPLPAGSLTPRTLITALLRRIGLLFELHADLPGLAEQASQLASQAESLTHRHQLNWRDWRRWSSRQRQNMALGGVVGKWTFEGNLESLAPWLWLGQWTHAGKNATMGLGRYEVSFSASRTPLSEDSKEIAQGGGQVIGTTTLSERD